jgi:hypothetical protein
LYQITPLPVKENILMGLSVLSSLKREITKGNRNFH